MISPVLPPSPPSTKTWLPDTVPASGRSRCVPSCLFTLQSLFVAHFLHVLYDYEHQLKTHLPPSRSCACKKSRKRQTSADHTSSSSSPPSCASPSPAVSQKPLASSRPTDPRPSKRCFAAVLCSLTSYFFDLERDQRHTLPDRDRYVYAIPCFPGNST